MSVQQQARRNLRGRNEDDKPYGKAVPVKEQTT